MHCEADSSQNGKSGKLFDLSHILVIPFGSSPLSTRAPDKRHDSCLCD